MSVTNIVSDIIVSVSAPPVVNMLVMFVIYCYVRILLVCNSIQNCVCVGVFPSSLCVFAPFNCVRRQLYVFAPINCVCYQSIYQSPALWSYDLCDFTDLQQKIYLITIIRVCLKTSELRLQSQSQLLLSSSNVSRLAIKNHWNLFAWLIGKTSTYFGD